MKLIVGLGNPGPQYEETRHNAGFLTLDRIAERFKITWSRTKFDGLGGTGTIYDCPVSLLKPMTFMNLSGQSVSSCARYLKLSAADIIVLHDDIDLETGKVKSRIAGGHGGHNGIRSIIDHLGNASFHRIKLGIGRPSLESRVTVHDWVLGRFSEEELKCLLGPMLDEVLQRLKPALAAN